MLGWGGLFALSGTPSCLSGFVLVLVLTLYLGFSGVSRKPGKELLKYSASQQRPVWPKSISRLENHREKHAFCVLLYRGHN